MTLPELVIAMTKTDREGMYRLAKDNPDHRCWYRNEFIDMVKRARSKAGVIPDGGALGDNFAGLDQVINLAGAWRRASRRAWREEEEQE